MVYGKQLPFMTVKRYISPLCLHKSHQSLERYPRLIHGLSMSRCGEEAWPVYHTHLINPTMHWTNIPQSTTLQQKCAQMCTFLLQKGALWDTRLVHCGICATCLLRLVTSLLRSVGLNINGDTYGSNAFWVSCNTLWAHVTGGNFHDFTKATDSPVHSFNGMKITCR